VIRILAVSFILFAAYHAAAPQSGRTRQFSESKSQRAPSDRHGSETESDSDDAASDPDVIRVETDLVTIPVRVLTKSGRPVSDINPSEFAVFENGIEQKLAFFSDQDQPFVVALLLDMSYSSVFKAENIRSAALAFIRQLSDEDRVMVVSFDGEVHVLCEPTNNRQAITIAIEGSRIGSGTAIYDAIHAAAADRLSSIPGRKAIVVLSDGVDTASSAVDSARVLSTLGETEILLYALRYDTYGDVQKSRRSTAPIQYDEDDRPYSVDPAPARGERASDYMDAKSFFRSAADATGGRVYVVSSSVNLDEAFRSIANELRKTYSLGYYPSGPRHRGARYGVMVRVYRPNLIVETRTTYTRR
jgi:VWFA-related protein